MQRAAARHLPREMAILGLVELALSFCRNRRRDPVAGRIGGASRGRGNVAAGRYRPGRGSDVHNRRHCLDHRSLPSGGLSQSQPVAGRYRVGRYHDLRYPVHSRRRPQSWSYRQPFLLHGRGAGRMARNHRLDPPCLRLCHQPHAPWSAASCCWATRGWSALSVSGCGQAADGCFDPVFLPNQPVSLKLLREQRIWSVVVASETRRPTRSTACSTANCAAFRSSAARLFMKNTCAGSISTR